MNLPRPTRLTVRDVPPAPSGFYVEARQGKTLFFLPCGSDRARAERAVTVLRELPNKARAIRIDPADVTYSGVRVVQGQPSAKHVLLWLEVQ